MIRLLDAVLALLHAETEERQARARVWATLERHLPELCRAHRRQRTDEEAPRPMVCLDREAEAFMRDLTDPLRIPCEAHGCAVGEPCPDAGGIEESGLESDEEMVA